MYSMYICWLIIVHVYLSDPQPVMKCEITRRVLVVISALQMKMQTQMTITNTAFDGKYYQEVVKRIGNQGFFQSDRALYNKSAGQAAGTCL